MNCKKVQNEIGKGVISDKALEHIKNCDACSLLSVQVDQTMKLLDHDIPSFNDMTLDILQKKRQLDIIPCKPSFGSHVAQLAVVIIMGIIIGITLGKNANSECFLNELKHKNKSLQQYLESHHLNGMKELGRF